MPACSNRGAAALRRLGALFPLLFLLFLDSGAYGQTLTQNTPLSFGRVVVTDNNAPRDITLLSSGGYIADPAYVFYAETPQLGSYTISGQAINSVMDIFIDVAATSLGPDVGTSPPQFFLVNPFTVPATVITDGVGNATFQVGATLRSNGGGQNFLDANYSGSFTIMVTPQ